MQSDEPRCCVGCHPRPAGDLYAASMKTCALALVYGPLFPAVYLWTCFACLFCYLCTRLAISKWCVAATSHLPNLPVPYFPISLLLHHSVCRAPSSGIASRRQSTSR